MRKTPERKGTVRIVMAAHRDCRNASATLAARLRGTDTAIVVSPACAHPRQRRKGTPKKSAIFSYPDRSGHFSQSFNRLDDDIKKAPFTSASLRTTFPDIDPSAGRSVTPRAPDLKAQRHASTPSIAAPALRKGLPRPPEHRSAFKLETSRFREMLLPFQPILH
ncbi:hypothetical protein ACQUJS_15635 [Ralstonia pseudosolanacearum]